MLKYTNFDIVFREIPDETTLAINISNCPNHCPGCHSPWLQTDTGDALTEDVLINLLERYGNAITCLCFMGGDESPDEVTQLAAFIQNRTESKIKTGWYSGRPELPPEFQIQYFQYIKLGGYIEALGALTSHTTNQRLYEIKEGQMIDITERFW